MKKWIIVSFVLALLVSANACFASASDIPQDVLTVAEDGVLLVQKEICKDPELWGFADTDTVKQMVLGNGYHVKFVGGTQLAQATKKNIDEIVDPSIIDTWEFTLDINGIPQMFLTVGYEEGMYQIVHYGGDATAFGMAKENLINLAANNNLSVQDELLKVENDYYFIADGDNEFVLPVANKNSRSSDLVAASELIEELQEKQTTNSEKERGTASANGNEADVKSILAVIVTFATLLFIGLITIYQKPKGKAE